MTSNKAQQTYLLQPHDPLLVRDGRPFTAGGFAKSLPFVMPTTLSGLVRTTAGQGGSYSPQEVEQLLQIEVRGPLLCDPTTQTLYFPAPLDAVVFEDDQAEDKSKDKDKNKSKLRPYALTPEAAPEGVISSLDSSLLPLTLPAGHKGKPASGAPRFWDAATFTAWLSGKNMQEVKGVTLEHERRIHVSINPETATAQDGKLFGTSSLNFQQKDGSPLGLLFGTTALLPAGAVPFGGERRLSLLSSSKLGWPELSATTLQAIADTGKVRVVLLTPAMFTEGWKPQRLLEAPFAVALKAAAIGRPEVVSGWDFQTNKPKPSRRLAPAGSVYFLEMGGTPDERRDWAKNIWLSNISDTEQDRRDGLGLAVLGVWATGDKA